MRPQSVSQSFSHSVSQSVSQSIRSVSQSVSHSVRLSAVSQSVSSHALLSFFKVHLTSSHELIKFAQFFLKRKVTPKSSFYCCRLQQVNIELLHPPKFHPLKWLLFLKKFVFKEASKFDFGGSLFETVLRNQERHFVQLKISRKQRNLQLTWHPSQGQQNVAFQRITNFTIFTNLLGGMTSRKRGLWAEWRQRCRILGCFKEESH